MTFALLSADYFDYFEEAFFINFTLVFRPLTHIFNQKSLTFARISQNFTDAIIVVIHFYLLFGFISMSLNLNLTFNLIKDIDLKVSNLMLIQIGIYIYIYIYIKLRLSKPWHYM